MDLEEIAAKLQESRPPVLAGADRFASIRQRRADDSALAQLCAWVKQVADAALEQPPSEREMEGRRLLGVSREALKRVLSLAFAYRIDGDARHLGRAREELLAVAAFSDWNPDHFLDVGEMAAAVAIGLDWLRDDLVDADQRALEEALIRHALQPVYGGERDGPRFWWETTKNNWNSVCYAGLVMAAVAVAPREPTLGATAISAAIRENPRALGEYAPDGVYPEGTAYWNYGTSFQVLLIDALRAALGDDFGLAGAPGFAESANFMLHATGPSGRNFNFADASERPDADWPLVWFARENDRPELARLAYERAAQRGGVPSDRLLAMAALWWPDHDKATDASDPPLAWAGRGKVPVVAMRTAWNDPNAAYLAAVGGPASANHNHMDAGSFVYERGGVRWAIDLGLQSYHSLERRGIALFDAGADSDRWTIFRLNNFSHNTLTVGGRLHQFDGKAELLAFDADAKSATFDLAPALAGITGQATRRFAMSEAGDVTITDEVCGVPAGEAVRWQLLTRADAELDGERATLEQDGQQLAVHSPGAAWQLRPAAPEPPTDYDAPNPGVQILYCDTEPDESGIVRREVTLRSL